MRRQAASIRELAHLVVDSTGLKVFGEGEWLENKHKIKVKRKRWRKLHLGLDLVSGEIICSKLTTDDVGDPTALPDLLDQIETPVSRFLADGAYDGVTAPSLPETVWFKLCGHGWCVQHSVVSFFSLGGRNVSDRVQKSPVVEPVHPFEGGELHGFEVAPWPSLMDDLGFVKAVDRFGESVVIGIANTANRRLNACLRQPFGILDRQVLDAAI